MKTQSSQFTALTKKAISSLVVLALLVVSTPGRAEVLGANTPAYTPPPQPENPSNQDRADNNGAAAAMAAMGAAIAGMSCMMLMREAQKTQDPSMKRLLMMQAMQQCGQAAQNAMSAGQNDKNKNQLQLDTSTPQQQLQTSPFKPNTESPQTAALPGGEFSENEFEPEGFGVSKSEKPGSAAKDSAVQVGELDQGGATGVDLPPEALKLIPPAKVGYDESAPDKSSPSAANGNRGVTAAAGAKLDDATKTVTADANTGPRNGKLRKRGNGEEDGEEGSFSSGNSSGEDNKGNDSLEAMMANLFGGPKEGALDVGVFGGGMDILNLSKAANSGEKPINIFEYASLRFRQSAFEEKRIRVRPPSERMPLRANASLSH